MWVHWDQTHSPFGNRYNGGSVHQVMVMPCQREWFHHSPVDSTCHPAALSPPLAYNLVLHNIGFHLDHGDDCICRELRRYSAPTVAQRKWQASARAARVAGQRNTICVAISFLATQQWQACRYSVQLASSVAGRHRCATPKWGMCQGNYSPPLLI